MCGRWFPYAHAICISLFRYVHSYFNSGMHTGTLPAFGEACSLLSSLFSNFIIHFLPLLTNNKQINFQIKPDFASQERSCVAQSNSIVSNLVLYMYHAGLNLSTTESHPKHHHQEWFLNADPGIISENMGYSHQTYKMWHAFYRSCIEYEYTLNFPPDYTEFCLRM